MLNRTITEQPHGAKMNTEICNMEQNLNYHHVIMVIQTDSNTTVRQRNDSIDLSYNAFLENSQHTYLAQKYPLAVQVLDSIFNDELKRRGISTQTAVTYTYMDSVMQKSRYDSTFFASSRQTEEVVLGVMGEIRIQGFALLTPGVILSQNPWQWILIAVAGIGIVFICVFGFIHFTKAESEPLETETIMETFLETEKIIENQQKTETIVLHKDQLLVIYNGQAIQLTNTIFNLFELLLTAPGYYLGYEQLTVFLYGSSVSNGNGRLAQLVKRLRNELLSQTPNVTVQNVRSRGYKLIIENKP